MKKLKILFSLTDNYNNYHDSPKDFYFVDVLNKF